MGLQFRIDVMDALRTKGYSSTRLRIEKLLSESTMTKLRAGQGLSWDNVETICRLLECQPGELLVYVPDEEERRG